MNRLIEDRLGERARVRERERAILVGLDLGQKASWQERESMEELIELAQTAKLVVLHTIIQKREHPDPAHFIGKGKAEELKNLASAAQADLIILNNALTPAQTRNLEELIQKKIVDRAQLILNIFVQRARSKEAKLQVELAQLEYLLPRLRGWAEALGQPGAGIATRGPGETRLVQEREAIQRRIHILKERLLKTEQERAVRRKLRQKNEIPQIALLGYTNTGKSTLLQALTGAETFIEDKLFATLDPMTRQLRLPNGQLVVMTDTVGLIKKLPHQLVPAFASTLEAVREADLLLNILDLSHPHLFDHWRTVQDVLHEVFDDAPRPPMLHLLNKIDKLGYLQSNEDQQQRLAEARRLIPNTVEISARAGLGLELLKERIVQALGERVRPAPPAV
ncbi:GTPase HflX [Candidatus Acetothermia bacterium]|jgi:GTP-binding protein HflX|nr:GTPase HflX [Candidatus Acetothermia bacterium]MCI2431265.1 GTPase HflX [Candidatus Acetothermia bacterium]MCI2436278.1 GTPase HflX [Candidatus Acetothermia bacterium]